MFKDRKETKRCNSSKSSLGYESKDIGEGLIKEGVSKN